MADKALGAHPGEWKGSHISHWLWPGHTSHPWPHPYTSSGPANTEERGCPHVSDPAMSAKGLWSFFGFDQALLNLPTCLSSLIKQQHILTWLSHLAKVLANVH